MRRGDLVTVAMSGDFGKPRPALVIQSDQFGAHPTVTMLLLSGTLVEATLIRLTVAPTAENGLRRSSQIMIDKAVTAKRHKIGAPFGRVDEETLVAVDRSLVLFLGLT